MTLWCFLKYADEGLLNSCVVYKQFKLLFCHFAHCSFSFFNACLLADGSCFLPLASCMFSPILPPGGSGQPSGRGGRVHWLGDYEAGLELHVFMSMLEDWWRVSLTINMSAAAASQQSACFFVSLTCVTSSSGAQPYPTSPHPHPQPFSKDLKTAPMLSVMEKPRVGTPETYKLGEPRNRSRQRK